MGKQQQRGPPLADGGKLTCAAQSLTTPAEYPQQDGNPPRPWGSRGAGMHLLQAARPERDQPVVAVDAEIREVLQQPIGKLLVPCGAGAPRLCQHGVVGPVVADPLFAEHVLVGGAGGVPPSPLLPGELALGVGQLQEHCSWRGGDTGRVSQPPGGRLGSAGVVLSP